AGVVAEGMAGAPDDAAGCCALRAGAGSVMVIACASSCLLWAGGSAGVLRFEPTTQDNKKPLVTRQGVVRGMASTQQIPLSCGALCWRAPPELAPGALTTAWAAAMDAGCRA